MELRLQLLDSFLSSGSDGKAYKVCAYDRLLHVPGTVDDWEPSGQVEYRLQDGRPVQVSREGAMRVAGTDVVLSAPAHSLQSS